MERKKINYEIYLNILFITLIYVICLWNIGDLNRLRTLSNEFGTWGIAASFAGYDWYDFLSMTDYYSFGYSFILIPLMLLGKVGVSMALLYKLAIILNAFFMVGQYLLILYTMKEMEIDWPVPLKQITVLFLVFYIGNVTWMNSAYSETYLWFMFWCVIALLIRTIKWQGYGNAFLLIAATAHIFAIHMRALGVVLAVIIVLAGWMIGNYKRCGLKYIGFVIGMSGFFTIITVLLKQFVSNSVYMGGNVNSVNDISRNVQATKSLFNVGSMIDVAMSVLGKLYYAGAASFLLAIVGLVLAVSLVMKYLYLRLKNGQAAKWQLREWLLLFVFVAFMGEIGISAIFKIFNYFGKGVTSTLADTIVFGRYADFAIGPMMFLGVWAIWHMKGYYKELIAAVLIFVVCTVGVQTEFDILSFYNGTENMGFRGYEAPWLAFLYQEKFDYFAYFAAGVSAAVFFIICFIRAVNMQKTMLLSIALLAVSLFWGIYGISFSKGYTIAKSNKDKTVNTVKEIVDAAGNGSPIYMVSRNGVSSDALILQWQLGEQSIHILTIEEVENFDLTQGIYLSDSGDVRVLGMLSDRMDYVYDSGTIAVFVSCNNEKYFDIADKAVAMGQVAEPLVKTVDLAQAATELSYQKENGSLYYNYQATDGGYMTREMGVNLEDGVYEFEVDIRVREASPDSEIGYITVGTAAGEIQDTYILNANDFADADRQVIPVQVTIEDWQEPVIGVYTYGNAAVRIYGITYHKIVGNTILDTEEWGSIAEVIGTGNTQLPIYYVDSDGSGATGFPQWTGRKMKYLSGGMMNYKETFERGYYVVEKSNDETVELCTGQMDLLQETEHYIIFAQQEI